MELKKNIDNKQKFNVFLIIPIESTPAVSQDNVYCLNEYIKKEEIEVYNVKDSFLKLLEEIKEECSKPNWDGYNAKPVNLKSAEYIEDFIKKLPIEIAMPEGGVRPNGNVYLEWKNKDYHLVLGIDGEGRLHYTIIIQETPKDVEMKAYDFNKSCIKSELVKLLEKF